MFGGTWSLDEAAAAFAGLCDRAAEHGLLVHLEFLPWSKIPDLATAWQIIRGADRPNGGLMLDAWHYFRSGPDSTLLRSIPGASILGVQLSDAPAAPEPEPLQATLHARLLPGQGAAGVADVADRPAGDGDGLHRWVSRSSPTHSMRSHRRRRAGWPAWHCAPSSTPNEPATSGQGDVVEIDPALSGSLDTAHHEIGSGRHGSVTGTLVQEVQADVLGTWRVAVPWTWPVAGSSARTVSADGVPVALAT